MFSMQNLNHSILNQVKSIFPKIYFLAILILCTSRQQQAVLFHLSNLTPRLNKVCTKREKSSKKSKENEDATLSSLVDVLRNDLVKVLRQEFRDSAKLKRNFSFDIKFTNPLEKILIKSSSVWSPSNCYISSGSFNLDKNSSAFSEHKQQNSYFANGGLNRVNRLEVR